MGQGIERIRLSSEVSLLHFNDNYSEWDWDMIPKTFRFWEHIELIFWLRELGYDKWYSIGITMPRGDAAKACQQSVDNIQRLCHLADKLDRDQILANLHTYRPSTKPASTLGFSV